MRTRAELRKFAEDPAAQALGTVSIILVVTVLPLLVAPIVLRERPSSRAHRQAQREARLQLRDDEQRAREEVVPSW